MKTKRERTTCPSMDDWTQTLDQGYANTDFEQHLENCSQCRATVEQLAAEEPLWNEAVQSLQSVGPELQHLTHSICPFAPKLDSHFSCDPLSAHEVEALRRILPAASHPELLARIGRYELEQVIGRGGMGLVFRALDTELHRIVAIKTLALHLLPIASARERFVREGRASAALSHPHIVPTHDVITDGPVPALVMQYIAGPTLEHWITERGPLSSDEIVRLGSQIADALCAAHAESLVHRDLKPANVLIEANGARALLTDFGLVRALHDATLTHSGVITGTPQFMSPEQARSRDVDNRSDLFSLGSLLYFMASGRTPFAGHDPIAILHSVCHDRHVPLRKIAPTIPPAMSNLVDRLLSKSPAGRPQHAYLVRDELRRLTNKGQLAASYLPRKRLWQGSLVAALTIATVGALSTFRFDALSKQPSLASLQSPFSDGVSVLVDQSESDADSMNADSMNEVASSATLRDRTAPPLFNEFDSSAAAIHLLAEEVDHLSTPDTFPFPSRSWDSLPDATSIDLSPVIEELNLIQMNLLQSDALP